MPTPLSIDRIESCSAVEWDEVWRACDYATFFHSSEWVEIWHRFRGDRVVAAPRTVLFSDGLRAVLPFASHVRGRGLLTTLTSSMEGTFGGWIASDGLQPEHTALLTDHLLTGLGTNLSWRINPYTPHLAQVLERARARANSLDLKGGKSARVLSYLRHFGRPLLIPDETHSLDLSPGISALFGTQSATARKAKKARKGGVLVRTAAGVDEWKEYYRVYQSSIERWGEDPAGAYTWDLFRDIFELSSKYVTLWIATSDSRIVSGALCFYSKRHVVYWHGSSLQEYFELRPVNLLMLEIIKDACERGYAYYDFNPSGHMQGVITFKESFGAKPLACPLIYVDTAIKRAARTALLVAKGP